jgi:hypothetical protein
MQILFIRQQQVYLRIETYDHVKLFNITGKNVKTRCTEVDATGSGCI